MGGARVYRRNLGRRAYSESGNSARPIVTPPLPVGRQAAAQADKWYVNVATPADPSGAIGGQIDATSTPKD